MQVTSVHPNTIKQIYRYEIWTWRYERDEKSVKVNIKRSVGESYF